MEFEINKLNRIFKELKCNRVTKLEFSPEYIGKLSRKNIEKKSSDLIDNHFYDFFYSDVRRAVENIVKNNYLDESFQKLNSDGYRRITFSLENGYGLRNNGEFKLELFKPYEETVHKIYGRLKYKKNYPLENGHDDVIEKHSPNHTNERGFLKFAVIN